MTNVALKVSTLNTEVPQEEQKTLIGHKVGNTLVAVAMSAIWGSLGRAGGSYQSIIWGSAYKFNIDEWKQCSISGNGCPLLPEQIEYNNAWVAAEFMLASKLSHMALKSLGFKPPVPVSLAIGLAATILKESNFDLANLAVSDTLSKAVITPIFGAILSAGVFLGIPAGLALCWGVLSCDPSETKREVSIEVMDTAIAEPSS